MDNKIKHLEMIEALIERMASNSFHLKGWAITLVAAIFVLSSKDANKWYMLIAYVPLVAFWLLDSFYLQLERKYKALYEEVRLKGEGEIDFNMNTSTVVTTVGNSKRINYCNCLFSTTEWLFYVPTVIAITIVIFLISR